MPAFLVVLGVALAALQKLVFGVAVVFAGLAALSVSVRTRRVSPFGGVGRFVRARVDPLFEPMERRLVRAGGVPTNAPWWTLAGVVVGGLLLLYLLGFVQGLLVQLLVAASAGSGPLLLELISLTFAALQLALFVRVISSWFSLSPYSKWVRWAFVLTDWIVNPLRQIVPPLGMFDVTPIVAYFALTLLERLVIGALAGALR
ncbi:MAG TPA: YggT family protein [Gemmatirosa sp.]